MVLGVLVAWSASIVAADVVPRNGNDVWYEGQTFRRQAEDQCFSQTGGCNENAECTTDTTKGESVCECKEGFQGDGSICNADTCPCVPGLTCQGGICVDPSCIEFTVRDFSYVPPANVIFFLEVNDCQGRPMSELPVASFEVTEDGYDVSSTESFQSLLPLGESVGVRTLIVVDLSGSVRPDLPKLITALQNFVDLTSNFFNQIAILGFGGGQDMIPYSNFTSSRTDLINAINSIPGNLPADESTNLNGAVVESLAFTAISEEVSTYELSLSNILLFTDGTDRSGFYTSSQAIDAIYSSDTNFYVAGVGTEQDLEVMREYGKDGFFPAENIQELDKVFGGIADSLMAEATNKYGLTYCSPSRTGNHSIEVKLKGQTSGNSATSEFNADGFGAGCSQTALLDPCDDGCGDVRGINCGPCPVVIEGGYTSVFRSGTATAVQVGDQTPTVFEVTSKDATSSKRRKRRETDGCVRVYSGSEQPPLPYFFEYAAPTNRTFGNDMQIAANATAFQVPYLTILISPQCQDQEVTFTNLNKEPVDNGGSGGGDTGGSSGDSNDDGGGGGGLSSGAIAAIVIFTIIGFVLLVYFGHKLYDHLDEHL
eukprot:Clim_evm64s150 gene=Clim_evmTU64s150